MHLKTKIIFELTHFRLMFKFFKEIQFLGPQTNICRGNFNNHCIFICNGKPSLPLPHPLKKWNANTCFPNMIAQMLPLEGSKLSLKSLWNQTQL